MNQISSSVTLLSYMNTIRRLDVVVPADITDETTLSAALRERWNSFNDTKVYRATMLSWEYE